MSKNYQWLAILILIPMLLFTFIVTVKTQSYSNNPTKIIYNYYNFKNQKDLNSISDLLYNQDELSKIELQLSSLDEINILSVKEDNNSSILNLYYRSNKNLDDIHEVKVYKVIYNATYDNQSQNIYKDGKYETWCFLIKENNSNEWLLDVCDS